MQTRSNALMIVLAALLVAGFVIAVTAQPVTATENKVDMKHDLAPYPGLDMAESWHERQPATCTLVAIPAEPMTIAEQLTINVAYGTPEPAESGRGSLLMSRVNCN